MRFIRNLLAVLGLSLVAAAAVASPDKPQNGIDYRTLGKPQQTDSGKKIEVTEFFWYACPHCHAFEKPLSDWVKSQGDRIVFKRVPVAFRESFVPQQKLYYTLEAMGKLEQLHPKIFAAIHVDHKTLDADSAVIDFVTSQGIDRKAFTDLYDSFGIQTKVRRATQLQGLYQIDGVPTIAIDGRYLTSPSIAGATLGNRPEPVLQAAALQIMNWLVAKSAADKGGAPAPAAAPKAKEAKPQQPAAPKKDKQ